MGKEGLSTPIIEQNKDKFFSDRRFVLITSIKAVAITAAGVAIEKLGELGLGYVSILDDDPVQSLEHPKKVECHASTTTFILTPEQHQQMRVRNFGDSVLFGFDGEDDQYPDAFYQVYGVNNNYDNQALTDDDLPYGGWEYTDSAIKGTEIWQWQKELEWYQIDRKLKEMNEGDPISDDTFNQSETWQVGVGGNNLFHFALKIREKLRQLYAYPPPPEVIKDVADGLQNVYKDAKKQYTQFLEVVYFLKKNGYAPHLDRLVLIGMTDPTVLDEVDIEDTNGKTLKLEIDENKRKYTRNAIINMNNVLKESINEFLLFHPDIDYQMLWIDPSEFLQEEDMHDVHPWRRGYWKIARKILDHYFVKGVKSKKLIQIGPLALPDNSPDRPKPEKRRIKRRALVKQFLKAA